MDGTKAFITLAFLLIPFAVMSENTLSPCRGSECSAGRFLGAEYSAYTDQLQRRVVTLKSQVGPHPTTSVAYYTHTGQLDEIKIYDSETMVLREQHQFTTNQKGKITYDEKGNKTSILLYSSQGADGSYRRIFQVWKDGKQIASREKILGQHAPAASRLNTCMQQLSPQSLTELPQVQGIVSSFLGSDRQASPFQINYQGCEENSQVQQLANESMAKGLRCLIDPAQGGSARGQRDAQLLFHLLSNADQPFTIRCQEAIIRSRQTGATPQQARQICSADQTQDRTDCQQALNSIGPLGSASTCPHDTPPNDPNIAPYPGMVLSNTKLDIVNDILGPQVGRRETQRSLFHEALHNVGHLHGQPPEVSYTCDKCCFPEGLSDEQKNTMCRLCRAPESAGSDPEYLADILENYHTIGIQSQKEAIGYIFSIGSYAVGANNNLYRDTIEAFLNKCSSNRQASLAQKARACAQTEMAGTVRELLLLASVHNQIMGGVWHPKAGGGYEFRQAPGNQDMVDLIAELRAQQSPAQGNIAQEELATLYTLANFKGVDIRTAKAVALQARSDATANARARINQSGEDEIIISSLVEEERRAWAGAIESYY